MHWSLMLAETDTRRLRCNNAKVLRLRIKALERLATQKETAKAKAAGHTKEHAHAIHRFLRLHLLGVG